MVRDKTIAMLLGYRLEPEDGEGFRSWSKPVTEHSRIVPVVIPRYGTDANASRELLAYVAKERRVIKFVTDLHRIIGDEVISDCGSNWAMLNATPQQIYAAFVQTFARELEQVERQS